jgi:hypothetical protein
MQEKVVDALAAKTVGYSPLRAFFLRIKETQGGRSTDVDDRLQMIDALEKMERNQQERPIQNPLAGCWDNIACCPRGTLITQVAQGCGRDAARESSAHATECVRDRN